MRKKIQSLVEFNLLSMLIVIGCISYFSAKVVSRNATLKKTTQDQAEYIYGTNLRVVSVPSIDQSPETLFVVTPQR